MFSAEGVKIAGLTLLLLIMAVVLFGGKQISSQQLSDQQSADIQPTELHEAVGLSVLPMTFAHQDHTDQNCVSCHHNYVDDTGALPCLECHITDPEVSHLFEQQFHDLCRGCHVEEQSQGMVSGPTRICVACHVADTLP